ncbi:MAG: antibiotic biosynthesis monooxygenase [Saprospiraceae bacterium]|nr:antibiotic biosynthesis monooxygenase [Saprospiraceae bacterium]
MNSQVYWHLEVQIKPGQRETLRGLMEEMVAHARLHEPGTLRYAWSISKDQTECHMYERYADSDAALAHMQHFREQFASRFMECVIPTRFLVYGNPTETLKAAWPPGAVQIFTPFGGF